MLMDLAKVIDLLTALRRESSAIERRRELLANEYDPVSRRLLADAEARLAVIVPDIEQLERETAEPD